MTYINRLHFLSGVDWYIACLSILTIDDVINVKKLKTVFSTFMTSSMVKMSHAIYQSTRLKKCSRLICIMTHYDHRWRHKCKKTRFYYQGVSPRWIYPIRPLTEKKTTQNWRNNFQKSTFFWNYAKFSLKVKNKNELLLKQKHIFVKNRETFLTGGQFLHSGDRKSRHSHP